MLDEVYKLRHAKTERRRWDAARTLRGVKLARWIRESLNQQADQELTKPK